HSTTCPVLSTSGGHFEAACRHSYKLPSRSSRTARLRCVGQRSACACERLSVSPIDRLTVTPRRVSRPLLRRGILLPLICREQTPHRHRRAAPYQALGRCPAPKPSRSPR